MFICIYLFLNISREKFRSTDIEFEKHIKDWFRHSNQRFKRESGVQNVQ